jgi:hypothetical protein
MPCSIAAMMNWNALHDLARERSRDMIDDPSASYRHLSREENLPASEEVFLYGRSALLINARVRAQARLRVTAAALDLT